MSIKGIIFDKDGTLFDFQSSWGASTFDFLSSLSDGNSTTLEDLGHALRFDLKQKVFFPDSIFIAGTARQTMDLLRPIIPNQTEGDILEKQQLSYSNLEQIPVKNLHGILKQLNDLGYLLNIATNDLKDSTLTQLKKFDIANFFIEVIGSDSGYGAKPEPSQLLEIARAVGLKASEAVMVGDSVHDMIAARKANFKAIGVLTGVATKKDLQPYSDVVFNDISYLLSWIEKQNVTNTITR